MNKEKANKQKEVLKKLIDELDLDKNEIRELLVTLYQDDDSFVLQRFIADLMKAAYIDITDLMDVCSYDADSILDEIGDNDIQEYCEWNNITINDYDKDDPCTDNPDNYLLYALKSYCSLKHKILDFDTVIEDVKDLLIMHGYDKKLL